MISLARKEQTGYVLVTLAATLVVILGFAALAVDLGVLYAARAAAQKAADAAALAGAFTFVVQPTAPQPATAVEHARQIAKTNGVFNVSLTDSDINVQVDLDARMVTVEITYPQRTFFARALGRNNVEIGARAVAEASGFATAAGCPKPWFVPNTFVSSLEPCEACQAGQVLIQNGQVTEFGYSRIGMQFMVKPHNPSEAFGAGQFFIVKLTPNDNGANTYRQFIAECAFQPVFCREFYELKSGNMVGPTNQGVAKLLGDNPDTYVGVGKYRRADGTFSDTSPQLVAAAIGNVCNMNGFCPEAGRKADDVQAIGFALLFIEGANGEGVVARLIGITNCGLPGPEGPRALPLGPYGTPLRLVKGSGGEGGNK